MLLAFSCTNSTTEAAVEKGTTTSALLSESNIVGGTAESVIHTGQRAATANEIVAAQETVLGNIYQTSLASVVQVKIVQRVQNEPSTFGFHFFRSLYPILRASSASTVSLEITMSK